MSHPHILTLPLALMEKHCWDTIAEYNSGTCIEEKAEMWRKKTVYTIYIFLIKFEAKECLAARK